MAHDEHAHVEDFPRAETAALVARVISAEERRARWQSILVAASVTCIALAFPTPAILGRTIELVTATEGGRWSGPHLATQLLAALLHALGMRSEPAWFLVSAIGAGLATWTLMSSAARHGWRARPRLLGIGAIVLAPVFVLAATTASAAGMELWGACLVFESLRSRDGEAPRPRRALLTWLFAALLHAWNGLLFPAVFSVFGKRAMPAVIGVLALWLALVVGASALEGIPPSELLRDLGRTLLAGAQGGSGPLIAWLAISVLGLGGGAIGLLAALVMHESGRNSPVPRWMLAFVFVPLVILGLGGVITWDVPCLWLVPPAYFGLGRLIGSRWTSPLGLLVIAGILGIPFARGALDGDVPFREALERNGRPGLVVLTHGENRMYLAEIRYEIDAIDSPEFEPDEMARGAIVAEIAARIRALRDQGRTVLYDPALLLGTTAHEPVGDRRAVQAIIDRTGIEPLR